MRAARVDANHAAVVAALRAAGALVASLAAVGKGVADLLVCHRGRLFLLEVKDGAKPPSARTLTPAQQGFVAAGWPVVVVTSPAEAVLALRDA